MSQQTEKVEEYLIQTVLDGTYPPGSTLPGERELAERLGVTRQNVQGVIQRLAREGWFTTGQRYATRVNDFWSQGSLNVLNALSQNIGDNHLAGFVGDLLAKAGSWRRPIPCRRWATPPAGGAVPGPGSCPGGRPGWPVLTSNCMGDLGQALRKQRSHPSPAEQLCRLEPESRHPRL